jgi:hypothetical protein
MYGFPASKGKGNPASREFLTRATTYLASSIPIDRYSKLGLSSDTHIVLPFNEKDIYDLEGRRVQLPALNGMSGSPVWELRRAEEGGPRIVGVFLEYRRAEKVIVASDIRFVLKLILDYTREHLKSS